MLSWFFFSSNDEKGEAPVFVRPLSPVRALDGESAKLTCTVNGKPIPVVAWFQGVRELKPTRDFQPSYDSASGVATLFIAEVFPDDEGVYRCKATNKHGTAECETNLIVGDTVVVSRQELIKPPVIVESLEPQRLDKGETAVLTARFDGYPAPVIKWYRNGREIQSSSTVAIQSKNKESTLTIVRCMPEDTGKYEVRALNDGGEARCAASIRLREISQDSVEYVPPKFVKALQPQKVPEGEAVVFHVEVESVPEAAFTWQQHGTTIQNSEKMQITNQSNRSTLFMHECVIESAGVYRVKAENEAGSVSSTATLTVERELQIDDLKPPVIVKELSPLKVMDGEEVSLVCQVHGIPLPRAKWYHNGQPVRDHRGVTMSLSQQGEAVLHFVEVFPEDGGLYECKAINAAGEAVTSASLYVESYEYIPDSESASITAGPSGTWEDGTGPSGSEDDLLSEKPRSKAEKKTKKFVPQESKEDDTIRDSGTAPRFVVAMKKQTDVDDGQSSRFEVKVDGYPPPVIRWYLNTKELSPSKDFEIDHLEDGTSILTLNEVFPDDAGDLMCEAQNENGVATCSTQLSVIEYKDSAMYRKPEWVTRMEEAKAKMLGNVHLPKIRVTRSDSERSMSLDSLPVHEFLAKYHSLGDVSTGSDSVFKSGCSSRQLSFKSTEFEPYTTTDFHDLTLSSSQFAQSVLSGYLKSHRQSISAAIDALSFPLNDSPDKTPVVSDDEFIDTLSDYDGEESDERSVTPVNSQDEIQDAPPRLEVPRHLNFSTNLSPIQENGETPTSDSSTMEQSLNKLEPCANVSTPDLVSAASMEELKEFLMLETLCTSYQ